MSAKRLVYQVLIGPPRPLWERCVASMAVYCRRHGITHHVQTEPILRIAPLHSHRSDNALRLGYLPILEKWAILSLFRLHQQIAVVDGDVYAAPDAPDIFDHLNPAADYAGVVERELPLSKAYARKLDAYERAQYGPLGNVGLPFINCGVGVFNESVLRFTGDDPWAFLRRPELQRFIDGEGAWRWQTEQTLWNWFIRQNGLTVQHLDPRFNQLFGMVDPGKREGGWFHHFLLSDHLSSSDPVEMVRTGRGRARV